MDGKNFVAIGRIIFETPGYSWNIPHTHFIVNKTETGLYEATNLEFILDSAGNSIKESAETLTRLTASYVREIMKRRRGHDELLEIVDSNTMEDYWREYRKIEINLSRTKRDMSHSMDRLTKMVIKETLIEYMKDVLREKAEQKVDEMLAAIQDDILCNVTMSVEYDVLEAA